MKTFRKGFHRKLWDVGILSIIKFLRFESSIDWGEGKNEAEWITCHSQRLARPGFKKFRPRPRL